MAATTVTASDIREAGRHYSDHSGLAKQLGFAQERIDLSGALDLTPPDGYVIGAIHVKSGTLTYGTGSTAAFTNMAAPANGDTLAADSWDLYKLSRLVTQAGGAGDYAIIYFE